MKIANSFLDLIKNNIQFTQTFILSFILFIGVYFFHLNISLNEIFITFFTVILLDSLFIKYKTGKWIFPYSGVNAGFGISFFLRSSDIIIYFFAGLLAIISKNIIVNKDNKHFMNPSNLGVFLSLILFPQYAWVNSLQWGNYTGDITNSYLFAITLVIILGITISFRVYKFFKFKYIIDLILPFFILHSILFFIIPENESINSYLLFFNTSFFIFAFFMITDPKTVPKKSITRIFFAFSIVFTFYILQFFINEAYAILGSLFFNTMTLPFVWKIEKKAKNVSYLYLTLYTIQISLIYYFITIYGNIDLVFNNLCNQLFCK